MRINIATLFPEMCDAVINTSIIGRAKNAGKVDIRTFNIRDYTLINTEMLTILRMGAVTVW